MSQFDKVEVMDFLINVLRDHEKSLDDLISRAEVIVNEKTAQEPDVDDSSNSKLIRVVLKDWQDFKQRIIGINLLCFNLLNNVFIVTASNGQKLFEYRESVPDVNNDLRQHNGDDNTIYLGNYKLSIGLELITKIVNTGSKEKKPHLLFDLDPNYTKMWLSKELHVNKSFIVCGGIEI
jgi:hypothetical protein